MKTLVLIGQPVSQSVSPPMQNAALRALDLPFHYKAVDVDVADIEATVGRIRSGEWEGMNITSPHKRNVMPYLDALTETAAAMGAVNTIFRDGDQLIGDNTDVGGVMADLQAYGFDVEDEPVLVFGAGGSARSVAYGLIKKGCEIRMVARTRAKAVALANDLRQSTGGRILIFDTNPTDVGQAALGCRLAINCTPLGMTPNIHSTPWPDVTKYPRDLRYCYDLVYNPAKTLFVRRARSNMLKAETGLGMLVYQGALSFERWTGRTPNIDVMRSAAEAALAKKNND